jgi:hypothetical protein
MTTTSYRRDRGYTRARHMGREEEGAAQLREMLDEPDLDPATMLAALIARAECPSFAISEPRRRSPAASSI